MIVGRGDTKMNSHLTMILTCVFFLILGIFLGNGAVYFFNKMPGKWLVDYGQKPDEELLHPTHQRVKSTPWKYVFTGFFIVVGIAMGTDDAYYAFAAVFALWLLLEMSIADIKYMIVPDQLILLLLVCGIGLIPRNEAGMTGCLCHPLKPLPSYSIVSKIFRSILSPKAKG